MLVLLRKLWGDEAGLILSAEMVIILTITVLGMIVGLVNLQNAILGEFTDLGLAFSSLNQSYSTPSYRGCWKYWGRTSWVAGSSFIDVYDGCYANNTTGCYGSDIASGGCCLPATTGAVVTDSCTSVPTVSEPCPSLSTTPMAVPQAGSSTTPALSPPDLMLPLPSPEPK
jgi:hypothetical protein